MALLIERGADLNLKSSEGKLPASYATTQRVQALFAPKAASSWKMPNGLPGRNDFRIHSRRENTPLNARLFAACRQNDVPGATQALADGAVLEVMDEFNRAPLALAYKSRAFAVGRLLVEHGAEVNALMGLSDVPIPNQPGMVDRTGANPALNFAIQAQHVESVRFLLHAGAAPHLFGYHAKAPLVTAVEQRNREIVEILVDAGAHPDFCGHGQSSALARALVLGDANLAELLLARGANPRAQRFSLVGGGSAEPLRLGPSLLMSAAVGGQRRTDAKTDRGRPGSQVRHDRRG